MSVNCGICQETVYPCEAVYLCGEEGRGVNKEKPHEEHHLGCMTQWAQTKANNRQRVVCTQVGCNTDISHLLPKPGLSWRTADYLSQRPAVAIFATGAPLLAINAVGGGTAGFAVAFAAGIVAAALEAPAVVGGAAAVIAGDRKTLALGGTRIALAAARIIGFRAVGKVALSVTVTAGVAFAALAGFYAVMNGQRNLISTCAALSLIATSTLINGSDLVWGGWFATISLGSAYLTAKFLG